MSIGCRQTVHSRKTTASALMESGTEEVTELCDAKDADRSSGVMQNRLWKP
jgi:hypothetical protein